MLNSSVAADEEINDRLGYNAAPDSAIL